MITRIKPLFIATILGTNSGLCYAFLVSTLTAYLADNNISLAMIGYLSLRTLPYSFKFLWAPLVDNLPIFAFARRFGQRKSWLISMQVCLIISLITIAMIDINDHLYLVCAISFFTAFLAATYDIAMDAYRINMSKSLDNNYINSFVVLGFRIGFIISGAICLFLSSIIAWKWVFILIAAAILACMITIIFSPFENDPINIPNNNVKNWFKSNVAVPFALLFRMPKFYLIIMVITFYKVSDGYVDNMLIPFLLKMNYSLTDIATISKTIGIGATIIGSFAGAALIRRFSLIKNLIVAEFLAASTNLLFISLVTSETSKSLLTLVICVENFCAGISNIALITYMSSICKHQKFTATHYAILVSISGLCRSLLGSTSGLVASEVGWVNFFVISSLLSIPSLVCLIILRQNNLKNNAI